jgi:hypothetical protein
MRRLGINPTQQLGGQHQGQYTEQQDRREVDDAEVGASAELSVSALSRLEGLVAEPLRHAQLSSHNRSAASAGSTSLSLGASAGGEGYSYASGGEQQLSFEQRYDDYDSRWQRGQQGQSSHHVDGTEEYYEEGSPEGGGGGGRSSRRSSGTGAGPRRIAAAATPATAAAVARSAEKRGGGGGGGGGGGLAAGIPASPAPAGRAPATPLRRPHRQEQPDEMMHQAAAVAAAAAGVER